MNTNQAELKFLNRFQVMHARTFETLKPCSNTFIDACILTASSRPTAVHFTYSTLKTSRMLCCVIGFSAVFAVWGDFQARMSTRHNEMVQVKRAGHRHVPARKVSQEQMLVLTQ